MNEYIPNGYTNWTEYNRVHAKMEKVKNWLGAAMAALLLIGAFVGDGIIETVL